MQTVLQAASIHVSLLSFLSPSPSSSFPSFFMSFSLCLSTPPTPPPPLPAVFAVSFSARHPEAAVAPASLPTSVFVVEDDMSKLWWAEEGRARGREREGRVRAHHSALRRSEGLCENVMWPAVRPATLLLQLFLWLSMWAGRNGDRKHPPPITSSSLLRSSSSLLLVPPSPPLPLLFLLLHPTFLSSQRLLSVMWLSRTSFFFLLLSARPSPSPTGVPAHHNSLSVEVWRGVLRCAEMWYVREQQSKYAWFCILWHHSLF